MANGQQRAQQNLAIFKAWAASKSDADFQVIIFQGVLSRTEIARECGFAKSSLNQNPRIKEALRSLEDGLRNRAVLPPLTPDSDEEIESSDIQKKAHQPTAVTPLSDGRESELLRRLQLENANQRAQIADLRGRLSKYESLHQALVSTGRMPR